jgi:DNA-directed RNA polymerase specialized sigma24 family protein
LPRLHRWARGRLPKAARGALDTGDIVQDVLVRALKQVPIFAPQHEWSFQAYLRQALMNRLRDEARRGQRRGYLLFPLPGQESANPLTGSVAHDLPGILHGQNVQ